MSAKMTKPAWLNNELIEKAFKKSEQDDSIKVIEISTKPGSEKGDNYSSDVYRVNVEFTRLKLSNIIHEKRSLIIKISHTESPIFKEMINEIDVVNLEIKMLMSTLVEMQKFLGDTKLCGKCLYGQDKPPAIIIEDLAVSGYRLADRKVGLDYQHSLLAIKNLAKFHASSVAVVEQDPSLKSFYGKGVFFKPCNSILMKQFLNGAMKSFATAVESWPELGPKYGNKLKKLSDNFYDLFAERTALNESEFNVINHGDCWVNNMMFHYDDNNKVDNQIFVDFQIPVYKSPAIDLNYFFNSSLSDETLSQRGKLLEEYFKVLTMTMKRIGCKTSPPTADELNRMMSKYEIYGLFAACVCLPIMALDKEHAKPIDDMMLDDGTIDDKGVTNPVFLKRVTKRLQKWDTMGLLDV